MGCSLPLAASKHNTKQVDVDWAVLFPVSIFSTLKAVVFFAMEFPLLVAALKQGV
jgi:hypothetical protein